MIINLSLKINKNAIEIFVILSITFELLLNLTKWIVRKAYIQNRFLEK